MAIKMKVNQNKQSTCLNCMVKYNDTEEMYDMMIATVYITLCKKCVDELFHKTLKASCKYNEKLKTKEDLIRIKRASKLRGIKSNE